MTGRAAGSSAARHIAWMCAAHVVSMPGFATYATLLPRLQQEWDKGGPPSELGDAALKPVAEAFVAAFDRDVKEGQEIVLRTTGDGKISVSVAGSKKEVGQNPRLAKAIWNIWLGAKPISGDMKKSLVERVDALGK